MKRTMLNVRKNLQKRDRLGWRVNLVLDAVFDFSMAVAFEPWMSLRMWWQRPTLPPLVRLPDAKTRVLVAPLNFAGQGYAWARAIEQFIPSAGATNLDIQHPGDFGFASDTSIPMGIQRYDRRWQLRESRAISQAFTHVLVESEAAIFGLLFGDDVEREQRFLNANGVSTAYVCHGSDIRSPEKHKLTTRFSPFFDAGVYFGRTQRRVDHNRAFLQSSNAPVFVSTPDLLNDYPAGIWLPVVVDVAEWTLGTGPILGGADGDVHGAPLVVHLPSRELVKGSHLIKAPLEDMDRNREIRFRAVSGVRASEARQMIATADIVLDQFRIGSYGVAACEAMAAGRVVVGHVTQTVRDVILQQTGMALPIVEADPENIGSVIRGLVGDRERMFAIAREGQRYVSMVHSGRLSADILSRHWLNG